MMGETKAELVVCNFSGVAERVGVAGPDDPPAPALARRRKILHFC
jgi:hypothetical protein